jgi:uncharacterized integral membrane protein (TIGR00698 family)
MRLVVTPYPLVVIFGSPPARSRAWIGVLACLAVALGAEAVSGVARSQGITLGALTVALIFGVSIGNAAPGRISSWGEGVTFAKKHLLRLGIVLYGFRLTLSDFEAGGLSILMIDFLVLLSTFVLAMWLGVRVLKLDVATAALIGAGASICGASAVLATAPVIGAKSAQASIAVSTVAVFGTAALLLYPALYRLNAELAWLPGGAHGYGVYIGSTVHEVGQVVAIANATGTATADPAVVTKMGRVALLAPFLLALAAWRRKTSGASDECATRLRDAMPWFPVLFAFAVLVNSLAPLQSVRPALGWLDTLALATAMAALGLSTPLSALKAAGPKPLVLAGALFVWLVIAGALINAAVSTLAASQ